METFADMTKDKLLSKVRPSLKRKAVTWIKLYASKWESKFNQVKTLRNTMNELKQEQEQEQSSSSQNPAVSVSSTSSRLMGGGGSRLQQHRAGQQKLSSFVVSAQGEGFCQS